MSRTISKNCSCCNALYLLAQTHYPVPYWALEIFWSNLAILRSLSVIMSCKSWWMCSETLFVASSYRILYYPGLVRTFKCLCTGSPLLCWNIDYNVCNAFLLKVSGNITLVTIDNPKRNQIMHIRPMNISLRYPRLKWLGNKSTIAVTKPSTPTNLKEKNITMFKYKYYPW